MAGIDGESLNRADGTRKWHRKVAATDVNGLCLWLGSESLKVGTLRSVPPKDESPPVKGFYNPSQYSTSYTTGSKDQGWEYYWQDPDSKKLTHHMTYCGSEWIGIARIPSEQNSSDKWNDWTHLMHWKPSFWTPQEIPRAEEVFDAVWMMTRDYPYDVRGLTNQLVSHFGLGKIDQEFLVDIFPWLDKRLGTKPGCNNE